MIWVSSVVTSFTTISLTSCCLADLCSLGFASQATYSRPLTCWSLLRHLVCDFMWLVVCRTTLSLANTSGLRRAGLETSATLESSTASLNHWWVRNSALNPAATEQHVSLWCVCDSLLQQKSVARKKCAGCKISVHTMCMEQLVKVNSLKWKTKLKRS